MKSLEVNFDGLTGPTHNYSGLSYGNIAATKHAKQISNPRASALQSLDKMQSFTQWGFKQGFFPPQERPNIPFLRALGFSGADHQVLVQAYQQAPKIFLASYSASSMWTANAATVSPSSDTQDGKVHFTVSNLFSNLHRAQEKDITMQWLKTIFSDENFFTIHAPLISCPFFSDEGAANHLRLCAEYDKKGLEIFVYGQSILQPNSQSPKHFPARQTREASLAIQRLHQLDPERSLVIQQNPEAIDKGVFHNDVISVANQNLFLYHELAFLEMDKISDFIKQKSGFPVYLIEVKEKELSLQEAVGSYLFNSQIVTKADGSMIMVAPLECKQDKNAYQVLQRILSEDNPINQLEFIDCRQSMQNGGGPACLRLRVVLTENQLNSTAENFYFNDTLGAKLKQWINQYYRDRLSIEELLDPKLLQESYEALDALTKILGLGSIYSFQKV